MAGYDTDAIAGALATALASLASDGVGVQAVSAMPSNPTPTGIYIYDGEIDYDTTGSRGCDHLQMLALLIVGNVSDLASQRRLRKLRDGASGVKSLIEKDVTLGGLVEDLRVTKASPPRPYTEKALTGVEFTIEIYAKP